MSERGVWERMLDKAERERDEAEAVVRLLVETEGECASGASHNGMALSCRGAPGHAERDEMHWCGRYDWHTLDEERPSPWTPDLLAALERITAEEER